MAHVPCLAINLKRSPERRAHVEAEFGKAGMPIEFIQAIDGKTMSSEELRAAAGSAQWDYLGCPLFPTEVACSLSHRLAMLTVIDRGWPRALVVEDDVQLPPDFADLLARALAVDVDWDMLKLGGLRLKRAKGRVLARRDDLVLARLQVPTLGGFAYVVTARGAGKIANGMIPIQAPYDFYIQRNWAIGLDVCDLLAYPVRTGGLATTISAVRDYKPNPRGWRARMKHRLWRLDCSIGKRVALLRWFGWRELIGLKPLQRLD